MKFSVRHFATASLALLSLTTLAACGFKSDDAQVASSSSSSASASASASSSASASASSSESSAKPLFGSASSASASASSAASASPSAAASSAKPLFGSSSSSASASASALASASPSPSKSVVSAAPAVIPDGYQVLTSGKYKISFALPGEWYIMTSDEWAQSETFKSRMEASGENLEEAQQQLKSIDIIGMSATSSPEGYTDNVGLLNQQLWVMGMTPTSQLTSMLLTTGGVELGETGSGMTPLGEAYWQSYTVQLNDTVTINNRLLAIPTGDDKMYSLVVVAAQDAGNTEILTQGILSSLQPA